MNHFIPRRVIFGFSSIVLLSLCCASARAGGDFQLHLESRSTAKNPPATAPSKPKWCADLFVTLDRPFNVRFVEGRTATWLQGTVHQLDADHARISMSVKRMSNQDTPASPATMLNTSSFSTTIRTSLSNKATIDLAGSPDGSRYILTLSPAEHQS